MNYPRVNLIRRNELRYQGVVSRNFIMLGVVGIPLAFMLLALGIKAIQKVEVESSLKTSSQHWETLSPKLMAFRARQGMHKQNEHLLSLLDAWQDSKVSFPALLLEVQPLIPASIQLTQFSVKSKAAVSSFSSKDDLALTFEATINGYSHGRQAESSVIALRKKLLASPVLLEVVDAVDLASIRKRDENIREFSLQGSSLEEGL